MEQRGDLPAALRHYQEGLRLDPKHATGQASLGRVLYREGRYEKATDLHRSSDVVEQRG